MGAPLVVLAVGGINSIGIGLVLPDLRRPSTMKEVGVWVVALFHGGELSIFRFFGGCLAISGAVLVSSFFANVPVSTGLGDLSLGSVERKRNF